MRRADVTDEAGLRSDAAAAGTWLRETLAQFDPAALDLKTSALALIGLETSARAAPPGRLPDAIPASAVRFVHALDRAHADALQSADPLLLALGGAIARACAPQAFAGVTALVRGQLDAHGAPPSARLALAARALGIRAHDISPVRADESAFLTALHGSGARVAELCDAIVLRAPCGSDEERRALGESLAARAFVALRGYQSFDAGLRIVRALAVSRLDDDAVSEAARVLRRHRRSDGPYGDLPTAPGSAGDIRARFHLPITALALWTTFEIVTRRSIADAISTTN
jgi:hypothetical protein